VSVTNSTISGNSTQGNGGGIRNNFGGTVTVTGSTISGNSASNDGGAIDNSGTVDLLNVTISGNGSGSGSEDVGGIWNEGTVNASFVTIANNTGSTTGAGGIFNSSGTVNIKNSIVGNNTSGGAPNCAGALTASGTNLATDGSCGMGFSNVPSTGPGGLNLGPLQVNAPGTTATHALQAGSAAIDAVTACTDLSGASVPTDQRGVSRPQGPACDVGAYEAAAVSTQGVTLEGGGNCLQLDLQARTYRFRTSTNVLFTGSIRLTQIRSLIQFDNLRMGEPQLLVGTVNLTPPGQGQAVLRTRFPLRTFFITDRNLSDNTCVP